MPRAPRDMESTTPKKRSRKAAPKNGNGNGVHAGNGNGAVETAVIPEVVSQAVTGATQMSPNLDEQIRLRAYELYVQRGGNGGSPLQDWLKAKEEICGRQEVA